MEVFAYVKKNDDGVTVVLFQTLGLAKKSWEFSFHKIPGTVFRYEHQLGSDTWLFCASKPVLESSFSPATERAWCLRKQIETDVTHL